MKKARFSNDKGFVNFRACSNTKLMIRPILRRFKGFQAYSFKIIVLLASVILTSSCVTNKKYQMLQKNDVNLSNLKADSVMRTYDVKKFDYKIQTNDVISVRFESLTSKEYDFLSGQTNIGGGGGLVGGSLLFGDLVDENGQIPFPVVGKIKVTGLTVFEIQDTLQNLANHYLESPIVKVRLLNYRVTFLGEVKREGVVALNNNRVTMLEAIGLAGGLSDIADKTNIKLIRQKGGLTEVVYINVQDENFINSPYYYANQNDILIVPALRQRPYRLYFGQNLSLVISALSLLLVALSYSKN